MLIRSLGEHWPAADGAAAPPEERKPGVVLAEHDPIARRVLGTVLRDAPQLDYICCVDSHRPVAEWPVGRADVVVIAVGAQDEFAAAARTLAAARKVLLVGTGWTRPRLAAGLDAGATGFLVKDTEIGRLATAAHAVADGHLVLSPALAGLLAHSPGASSAPTPRQAAAPPRAAVSGVPGASAGTARAARRPGPERLLESLTQREREVLDLLADGLSTAEVARALTLSPATVKSHVSHALTKLDTRNRVEAVLLVQRIRYATGQRDTGQRDAG
ncbi:LuxR C-terminal-related transcriptional regulator [Streptomyces sp. PR69]|uniref:LuxR C-terminal-related transcriptional regulator n=1 Tax=Streptomyces sp. PR69 TaxID=2984950 RepID=UPI0022651FF9|nr:response regulator transcription factor [Streptomyces sp. PR69]